jgi:hypothetical protein
MSGGILVGGCGSSGTTLFSHLLNQSKSIFCGPELNLLNKKELYRREFRYTTEVFQQLLNGGIATIGELDTDLLGSSTMMHPKSDRTFMLNLESFGYSNKEVCELASQCKEFRQFVENFFQKPLQKAGKSLWAEKTPSNAYCIEEFMRLYEEGFYIHIVRDGRDVVASLIKRGYKPENAVRRWMHDTAAGFPHRAHERFIEVKYEDLVTQPESTMKDVFDRLGLAEAASQVFTAAGGERHRIKGIDSWGAQPSEDLSRDGIDKWKRCGYERKTFIQELFKHTYLEKALSRKWGLGRKCNGNRLLVLKGYDPLDEWGVVGRRSLRFWMHYAQEKAFAAVRPRRLYCYVSPKH